MQILNKIKYLFSAPVADIGCFDGMSMSDIRKFDGSFVLDGTTYEPTEYNLNKAITTRLKQLVSNRVTAPDLDILISETGENVVCTLTEHNQHVDEWLRDHKFKFDTSRYDYVSMSMTNYAKCNMTIGISCSYGSLNNIADLLVCDIMSATMSFGNLKKLADRVQSIEQTVKSIIVSHTLEDDWIIDGYLITPELLDGFIEECSKELDPTEAKELRSNLITKFSQNGAVDYNFPEVTAPTPDSWKDTFHNVIEPERNRRKRCQDVIDEIKSQPEYREANLCANTSPREIIDYTTGRLLLAPYSAHQL